MGNLTAQDGACYVSTMLLLPSLLGGLISGVVGVVCALFVDKWKRIRDARDRFAVFIAQKLEQVPQNAVQDHYILTKPEIRDEVARWRPFLKPEARAKLDQAWTKYATIPHNDLDLENESGFSVAFEKQFGNKQYQHPREIVRSHLEELYSLVG